MRWDSKSLNWHKNTNTASHIFTHPGFESLQDYLKEHPLSKSSILIKGSRGMALERVLDLL